ncbi:tetratricopeptide repeat protein [Telmatospirillum siberiense]|nr:tetratricopeptide repeat protein [Telmatospirillum siberiense]
MRKLDLAQALTEAFGHLDAGRTADAGRLARDIERARPAAPGLRYLQGLLALAGGDGRKATQHLLKALAQTPDAPPALLALARAQAAQGRTVAAEAVYRRLLALSPAMAEAYGEWGVLLAASEKTAAASALFARAVALRPDWSWAWTHLGVTQRSLGKWDGAALSFARAVDLDEASAQALANLAGVLRRLKRPAESVALARRAVSLEPAAAGHWLELAQAERDADDLGAAIGAVAEASRLDPDNAEAAWLEGECLAAEGRAGDARAAYRRVLALDPADRFGARLALSRLGADPLPSEAPAAFVQTLFDQYADGFDRDLVDGLHYRGPAILSDAIFRALGSGPFAVCDAGCGTGLMGLALRSAASRLDGVDLSPRMVEKARARGIYDDLQAGGLVQSLLARPGAYDLVSAADVLIYVGDLQPVFAAVRTALRPDGAFAFTVETHAGKGYIVQESRRFAHAESYLREEAAVAGFTLLSMESAWARHDRGQPVPGLVVVLRKTAPAGAVPPNP